MNRIGYNSKMLCSMATVALDAPFASRSHVVATHESIVICVKGS